jgi:hypothetical protein
MFVVGHFTTAKRLKKSSHQNFMRNTSLETILRMKMMPVKMMENIIGGLHEKSRRGEIPQWVLVMLSVAESGPKCQGPQLMC